jgi:hypothetical protein
LEPEMALDEADKKFITDLLGASLKEATKDFATTETLKKVVDQNIAKAVEGLKIDDKIAAMKPKDEPKDDTAAKAKGDKIDPELAKLQEKLTQLEQKNRATEERAQAETAKREESEAISAWREALAANGVPSDRQAIAIAKLHHADKLTKRDAEGKLHVSVARAAGYTDNLSLTDFVKEYVGTDEGKTFLPPTGASGTGTGGSTEKRGGGNKTVVTDPAALDFSRVNFADIS